MIRSEVAWSQCRRLHEARRRAGLFERARKVLAAQRASRRMLHHDRVARQDCRHHHVHRGEQRIVPRGQIEHHAERRLGDAPHEPRLVARDDVGQRLFGDARHVARTKRHPIDLAARLSQGLAHHGGDVPRDVVGASHHRIGRREHERNAVSNRRSCGCPSAGRRAIEHAARGARHRLARPCKPVRR